MIRLLVGAALLAFAQGPNPAQPAEQLGTHLGGLSDQEKALFNSGRALFRKNFSPTGEFFNARSCITCHGEPTLGGGSASAFNVAFFVPDPNDISGMVNRPWLQALNGRTVGQRLPMGDYEVRQANPLYGLGLLEAVPEAQILAREDASDKDKDGISGRALRLAVGKIGRLGWKGSFATIDDFAVKAFEVELGHAVGEGSGANALSHEDAAAVGQTIRFLSFAKPKPMTQTRQKGQALFRKIGCASCHTEILTTGDSPYPGIANREIQPYTDLLLHDLGRGPAKLTTSGAASRSEFRTAALWGLGARSGPYFHDASTPTVEEAIIRHEGEAMKSRDRWKALNVEQKKWLDEFLRGL